VQRQLEQLESRLARQSVDEGARRLDGAPSLERTGHQSLHEVQPADVDERALDAFFNDETD
jgi:hypothetical protein